MNQRSKRTEKDVLWLKNRHNSGLLSTRNLETIQDDLPHMPFTEWCEVLKFEEGLASANGKSLKRAMVGS